MITIRPYRPEDDGAVAFALWQATLGGEWPLTPAQFGQVVASPPLYRDGDDFVAEDNGRIVGFVATQAQRSACVPQPGGNIIVLLVDPPAQRRGVGRALQAQAVAHLHATGMAEAQVGGRVPRLWPGVPDTLPAAQAFFQACGWTFGAPSYDLVQHLSGYATPPGVMEKLADQGVRLDIAGAADLPDLLAFEDREFGNWAQEYHTAVGLGDTADCLIARDSSGPIVGALLLYGPQSHPQRMDAIWQGLLGATVGSIGAVGVAEAARQRGIGLALVARGSELLRERGVGYCHIGWLTLVDFYGKLGYMHWHTYAMSSRALSTDEE